MKLDNLVLTIVCVVAGTAITLWLCMILLAALEIPFVLIAFVPAALVGYIVFRVVAERVGNAEEDHYDRMDH